MPAERPWVMSNMLVTIWNSVIDSRLKRGCPNPEPATFCVICWPSRLSCQRSSIAPVPTLFPMSLAVTPLTSFDSSIQLRPCSGSASIWRRSTLPATCDEAVSTSGVSPTTVSVSVTEASFIVNGIVAFWPTRISTSRSTTVVNPESSAWMVYLPAGTLASRYSPFSLVTAASCRPASWSVAVTLTPGSTAFVSSTATPTIEPCCAYTTELTRTATATRTATRNLLTDHPPSELGIWNVECGMRGTNSEFQIHNSKLLSAATALLSLPDDSTADGRRIRVRWRSRGGPSASS